MSCFGEKADRQLVVEKVHKSSRYLDEANVKLVILPQSK
jgi:hypothetical protein